jgi:GT2 family glycosyltransferase
LLPLRTGQVEVASGHILHYGVRRSGAAFVTLESGIKPLHSRAESRQSEDMILKTSVIIPVYDAVRALELVLTGYCRQTAHDFEVFIADDGSGPEVRRFIDDFAPHAPFPIKYTRQRDEGFRRARILNQAVRESSAHYLIFADGDCIPHSHFVEGHLAGSGSRLVHCGRRVHLSKRMSDCLTPQGVLAGKLERVTPARVLDVLLSRGGHWDEGFVLRNRALHRWVNYKKVTLLGSNFSLERSLLEEINGFNEDFVGYGGEDTEIECRLRRAGARLCWVRHRAIQYHLYHPTRSSSQANLAVLERTLASGKAMCPNGLRKTGN